jgi:hypothetical protein
MSIYYRKTPQKVWWKKEKMKMFFVECQRKTLDKDSFFVECQRLALSKSNGRQL